MDKIQIQVLLIEDNPVDIVFLREALGQDALNSFDLTTVEHLHTAIETLQNHSFDIILLDLGLPDSQGFETFTRIQQLFPEIPKIILSGLTDEALALQAVHVGAQDYIVKGAAGFSAAARAIRYAIERQQAQRALRMSEARYHQVLDTMMEGCQIIDFDWRYIYINEAAETHNRRPQDELLGRKFMDMWPGIEATELFAEIKHCMEKRVVAQLETEFIFPDGPRGYFSISIQPVPEGVFILSTDITESKITRDSVRANEERFRAMVENGLDDISLLDINGNLLWESPAVVRNLGYPENAFVGQNIFEIVHPEDKAWTSALYAKLIEVPGSRQEGKFRLQRSDGTWRWVEAIVTNMLDNPSVQAIVVNYRDITERKQAEANYQAIFERAAEGIFQSSPEGRYINVNPAMARIYGYASPQEMIESIHDIAQQIYLGPQERAEFTRLFNSDGSVNNFEMKNKRKDGSMIWTSTTARAVRATDGKLLYYEGFLQDITERKQAEAALRASEERYRGIFDGVQDAIFVESLKGEILDVNQRACEIFGYTHAEFLTKQVSDIVPSEEYLIRLWDDENISLEHSYETLNVRANGEQFPVEIRIGFYEFGDRKLFLVVLRDITERKKTEATIRSLAKFPEENPNPILRIGKEGQIIYANNTANHLWLEAWGASLNDPLPEEWQVLAVDAYQRNTKQALDMSIQGHMYAISIVPFPEDGYTNVYGQDVTESRQAEEKVRTAHEFLQGVQNALSAHIAILDETGNIVQVNSAWREFADQNGLVHPNYGIGLNYFEICDSAASADADEAPLVANAIREILAGKMGQAQIEYPCHSPAEQRWFLLQITSFKDGDKKFVVLAHENITERKLAEEVVRETSEQFHTLFEASPEAIMIIDPHGAWPILDCNATGCAMNGYTRAELIGQSVDIFNMTPGKPTERSEYLERVRKAGILRYETSHRRKDGTVFPVEVSTSLITFSGREVVLGIDRDITERKQAENRIRESQARLAEAQIMAKVGSWETDLTTLQVVWSDETYRIFELDTNTFSASHPAFLGFVHPEDRKKVDEAFAGSLEKDSFNTIEHRILTSKGNVKFVEEHWRVESDTQGRPVRAVGTCQDITERKQAEEKLHASETRYRLATLATRDVIWEWRPDTSQLTWAENAENVFGYRPEEIGPTDKWWDEHVHPEDRERVISKLTAVVDGNESIWLDEYRFLLKDGTYAYISDHGYVERDISGKAIRIIGAMSNITESKQVEEKLHASEERYRQLVDNFPNGTVAVYNRDLQLTFVAGSDLKKFNAQPQDFLEKKFQELAPAETFSIAEPFLRAAFQGQGGTYETPYWNDRYYFVNVAPIHKTDGRVDEIQVISQNITESKKAEIALRESEAVYRQAIEVAGAVPYYQSYYDNGKSIKYEFIGEGIRQITGYGPDEFSAKLWDTLVEEVNLVEDLAGYALDEGIQRVRSGENPVWKCEHRIRARDGQIHWVFEAAVELRDEHGVSHGSIGTYQDITERKQAEQTRQDAEAKYRALVEQIPAAVYLWELGEAGTCHYISPRIEIMLGFSTDEWLNDRDLFFRQVHPDDREFVLAAENHSRKTGEPLHSEFRMRTHDDRVIWVRDESNILPEKANQPRLNQGLLSDITERKQHEQELHESHERFQQLADNIEEVFWITDAINEEEIYLSPAAEKIWGHSIEKLMQTPRAFIEHILPEDHAAVLRALEAQKNGERTEIEYRVLQPDESVHWIWDRAFPIFDEAGKVVRLAGIAADITERKEAENALELRDALLRDSQRIARLGHYRFIFSTGLWESSDVLNEVLGIDQDYLTDMNGWANLVHPAQRAEMLAYFTVHVMEKHNAFDREYQIIRNNDGQARWVHGLGRLEFDAAGNLIQMIGTIQDITERKQAEAGTRRHLAELEALYENGLAVGQLLETRKIGERIIATFARHLSWHHVAIRLLEPERNEMRLVAFNQEGLNATEINAAELLLNSTISKVGQGLSGWVVQTGQALRTGNVHDRPQYVTTYPNIQSGLYMPLKIGETIIGVISVESDEPNAFTEQDERLLATLANQAAIAFENARLYQSVQQELQERKRAETALRTSETHYRELADSITDIFFELDQNLHYSHWNTASEILTAVPEAEAIGKSMHEILVESEDGARIENIYKSVLLNHQPRIFETLFNVNNGQRSFEVNAYPSMRGIAVIAKDITERKRSETIMQKRFELMEYAARHSLTEIMEMTIAEVGNLTGSAFGFFHIMEADQTTPSLQIWSINALSLFNVPVSEGTHRPVEQAGVWADAIRQRRAIIHNDYASLPNKKDLPPGHAPLIREMVIPIIRNEKILAVLGVANKPQEYTQQDLEITGRFVDYAWDITERKQMEMALADERNQLALRVDERTADLSRANANLGRALRVKDEFLANMSHELRTPLNAILGLSESLAEQTAGPLNEKQQRYITTVTESGHHLLSLINDILDLAKIEAGQIELDVNKVDIRSVCDASMRMIKQLARKKNQDTVVEIDSKLGLMWADERRLKQMLVNLLSNAVKFTPEGGKLGLEVHGDQDENKITFTVWDTGIGIKETDLPRLFQPFVQLDAGLARESSGTGLGLALVTQMARMHGGSASVVSEPGKGSRFSIMLPWEPALVVDTLERLKITGKFKPVKFNKDHKPTILLIEDTEEVIMMLSDYLELNGFKTITARDGIEGITQAQLTHPDLILMDIQMPRMDGFETTKKLRSEPEFKTTPIIALTALAMQNDRERCLAAGMDEYITKPVHLRALVKMIELFLSGEAEVKNP